MTFFLKDMMDSCSVISSQLLIPSGIRLIRYEDLFYLWGFFNMCQMMMEMAKMFGLLDEGLASVGL